LCSRLAPSTLLNLGTQALKEALRRHLRHVKGDLVRLEASALAALANQVNNAVTAGTGVVELNPNLGNGVVVDVGREVEQLEKELEKVAAERVGPCIASGRTANGLGENVAEEALVVGSSRGRAGVRGARLGVDRLDEVEAAERERETNSLQVRYVSNRSTHELGTLGRAISDNTLHNLLEPRVDSFALLSVADRAVNAAGNDRLLELVVGLLLKRGTGTEGELDSLVTLTKVEEDLGAEEGSEGTRLNRELGELGVGERLAGALAM